MGENNDKMRKRPSWMTASDESILELLSERNVALKPAGIKVNLEVIGVSISKRTIYRRIELLAQAGMIEETDYQDGYWMTTDIADKWLAGELSADDIRRKYEE